MTTEEQTALDTATTDTAAELAAAELAAAELAAAELAATWPYPHGWNWEGIRLGWPKDWPHPWRSGNQNSTLLLGPPRSGKTTGIVAPAVNEAPGAVVATSTKGDLAELTIAARQHAGRCWYFDPSGTTTAPAGATAARWSPIPGCETWQTALARAHALAATAATAHGEHAHWIERAEALLAPLFHAAALMRLDIIWPLRWVLRRELSEPLRALAHGRGDELAGDTLQGVADTDERERSGIFSTAARLLAVYRNPTALAAAAEPNFDPNNFVHSADTLYVVAPSIDQDQLAPIIVSLLDQIRHHTYRRHPSWPPLLFALDEVANIAPLPDLPAIIAEGASQGLITLTCLQDQNQARARWGTQADGFLTLHGVKIALGGIADTNTLRALSYLAGQQDIAWKTAHTKPFFAWSYQDGWNHTVQQRPRIPPDHIRRMPPGIAYLAHTHHPPQYINLRPPKTPNNAPSISWQKVKRSVTTAMFGPSTEGSKQ